jgi:hypothetical protein
MAGPVGAKFAKNKHSVQRVDDDIRTAFGNPAATPSSSEKKDMRVSRG